MDLSFKRWLEFEQPTATWQPPPTQAGTDASTQVVMGQTRSSPEGSQADQEYKKTYVHPDLVFHGQPEHTFFYTPSGRLWTFPGNVTHQQALVGKKPTYARESVEAPPTQPPNWEAFRDIFGPDATLGVINQKNNFTNACLLGRTGAYNGKKYASFWNSPEPLVQKLMMSCLKTLVEKKVAAEDYLVSHPSLKDVTVGDVIRSGVLKTKRDPAAEEWAAKARELHLLPSDQKRQRMKELGLASTQPSRSSAWQSAMQKANVGYHAPWRGTSESS